MAAVEVARNEKISLREALRFVAARWKSYMFAPFAPAIGLAVCAVLLMVFFGLPNWIPFLAEFWVGLLLPLALVLGLGMAIILIGLPGWPMIHATLGAEGSDSFDALSRCYSYVLQKPWSYIWYALIALAYGVVVVFFVGVMGSLMVYLAKWGISQTPLTHYFHRDPSYMFQWTPTSFQWRALLLEGASGTTASVPADWNAWNYVGPFCVAVWLGLVFLMVIGFGYSFFWSTSTIIYLMMHRNVDDTELDEVYLEEEEPEESYTPLRHLLRLVRSRLRALPRDCKWWRRRRSCVPAPRQPLLPPHRPRWPNRLLRPARVMETFRQEAWRTLEVDAVVFTFRALVPRVTLGTRGAKRKPTR